MNPNYENIEPLVNYIKANHIKTPLKLEIGLDKVSSDGMTRYFTIKINGDDVTGMVAKALDNKISKAKDTPFKMIVHGCGMDMGFAVQYQLYREFASADLGDLIDKNNYAWLGKIKNGKYPYDNKYNFTSFDKMLRDFDENGKYAECKEFSIALGGYDKWFEISYKGQPVCDCVDGDIQVWGVPDITRNIIENKLYNWDNKLKFEEDKCVEEEQEEVLE